MQKGKKIYRYIFAYLCAFSGISENIFFKEKHLSQFFHVYSHMLLQISFSLKMSHSFVMNNMRETKMGKKSAFGTFLTFDISTTL